MTLPICLMTLFISLTYIFSQSMYYLDGALYTDIFLTKMSSCYIWTTTDLKACPGQSSLKVVLNQYKQAFGSVVYNLKVKNVAVTNFGSILPTLLFTNACSQWYLKLAFLTNIKAICVIIIVFIVFMSKKWSRSCTRLKILIHTISLYFDLLIIYMKIYIKIYSHLQMLKNTLFLAKKFFKSFIIYSKN